MTPDDARRLTVGTSLAHRNNTRWTVTAIPTRPGGFILAELRGPTGGRDFLTTANVAEFIPEPARCVEKDALEHWTCVVAWGTPDRRVASALAVENQAGRWRRQKMIGERAREAGWPERTTGRSAVVSSAAMRRLEGGDWSLTRRAERHRVAAYESRRAAGVSAPVADDEVDGDPTTIFDE